MALQILNLSVYGGDLDINFDYSQQNNIGEFNQIDSLIEYVTEIVFDYKNAFPENGSHNPNSKSSHQLKHFNIKMVAFKRTFEQPIYSIVINMPEIFNDTYTKLILKEINPPPPKAI